jgi:hypothetical protein
MKQVLNRWAHQKHTGLLMCPAIQQWYWSLKSQDKCRVTKEEIKFWGNQQITRCLTTKYITMMHQMWIMQLSHYSLYSFLRPSKALCYETNHSCLSVSSQCWTHQTMQLLITNCSPFSYQFLPLRPHILLPITTCSPFSGQFLPLCPHSLLPVTTCSPFSCQFLPLCPHILLCSLWLLRTGTLEAFIYKFRATQYRP